MELVVSPTCLSWLLFDEITIYDTKLVFTHIFREEQPCFNLSVAIAPQRAVTYSFHQDDMDTNGHAGAPEPVQQVWRTPDQCSSQKVEINAHVRGFAIGLQRQAVNACTVVASSA